MLADWHTDGAILLRMIAAAGFGAVIGWDRQRSGHGAGLRTNMLVALTAAMFTATGDLLMSHYEHYGTMVRLDPTRILNAIVIGVSFLGSGIIFVSHKDDRVLGLTTAATVWAVTGLGIVVGLGHYVLGCGVTLLVYFVLEVLRKIEERMAPNGTANAPDH